MRNLLNLLEAGTQKLIRTAKPWRRHQHQATLSRQCCECALCALLQHLVWFLWRSRALERKPTLFVHAHVHELAGSRRSQASSHGSLCPRQRQARFCERTFRYWQTLWGTLDCDARVGRQSACVCCLPTAASPRRLTQTRVAARGRSRSCREQGMLGMLLELLRKLLEDVPRSQLAKEAYKQLSLRVLAKSSVCVAWWCS